MFKMSFESATFAGLMAAIAEAASHSGTVVSGNSGGVINITSHATGADPEAGPINPNAPAVDSSGLPWDERIHSANKAQIADGTWRKRRGVDAATVASVEMELRARMAAGQQQQQFNPNAGNVQQQQTAFNPNQQQFNPNAGNVQQQPPMVDFGGLMQIISTGMAAQTITNQDIAALVQNLGIANVALLQNDPARIQQAITLLRQWGKIA